ncbi:hypothetical protein BFJ65_g4782 [Fusarium oxysporum f. sp. cepae]|uniref:Uncharacterized protein n=1 Tax=Fusarium oxysporum f. sp. cepae TaxID=396571 RepID=A0A3L6NUU9_FUSOX|nr:hypothetical protein BFJ65_g4782 [Fusarium oxysporum f. sp. cepae]RKK48128.1 hypothetical protein BFJ67_g7468 [Fusarium oxysporum f. sp. cepae]
MSQNMNTLVELMTMGDAMCCAEKLSYAWSLVTRVFFGSLSDSLRSFASFASFAVGLVTMELLRPAEERRDRPPCQSSIFRRLCAHNRRVVAITRRN